MIPGRLVVVEMILGFRSKVLVILIKCSLKILDSFLSSETMQSLWLCNIISLEKFPFSVKYGLIVRQKFLLSDRSFAYTFEK